jgi:hypothetical protein
VTQKKKTELEEEYKDKMTREQEDNVKKEHNIVEVGGGVGKSTNDIKMTNKKIVNTTRKIIEKRREILLRNTKTYNAIEALNPYTTN